MDLGTGLFAAIHAHSLLRRDEQHRARNKNAQTQDLPSARISQIVLLAAIGLLRVGFIAISGYAQDIAEYGEHWNFFLTLAAMQVSSRTTRILLCVLSFVGRQQMCAFRFLFSLRDE